MSSWQQGLALLELYKRQIDRNHLVNRYCMFVIEMRTFGQKELMPLDILSRFVRLQ
ncbi:hypothetical protein D3C72_2082640 [compost metagenome]